MLSRKIAYIDLTKGTISKEEIPLEWRKKYLGARGINEYLLYSLMEPPYDPLSPENPLIMGVGLLTGVPGFGTARFNVSALAPASGNLGRSNCGGHFGPELRYAGFDHLVIRGKSDIPVYLMIKNDEITIRDARHIWGEDTWETQEIIKKENRDERVRAMAIGVAGENLVRMANIINGPKSSASRTGMGAVMGSKKLKAIAVRGTKDVTVTYPQELLKYVKEQTDKFLSTKWAMALKRLGTLLFFGPANEGGWLLPRNAQSPPLGEKARSLYGENMDKHTIGMSGCFGCAVQCRHRHLIKEGRFAGTRGEGPDYGGLYSLGSNLEVVDLEAVTYASQLCNRLGLDLQDTGNMIAFAMDLYQKELISEEDAGKPLEWGDAEVMLSLIRDIANRQGFGDVLAEGVYSLKQLRPEAEKCLPRIRNLIIDVLGGRVLKGATLGMAVASLGGHIQENRPSIEALRLPAEALQNLYGGYISPEYNSYEGKSLMVWWHELLHALTDSLGCCLFQTAFSSPRAPKHEEYSELIRLTTGLEIPVSELREIAQRICTTERLILGELGVGSRKDDTLPETWFSEPIIGGAAEGESMDETKFNQCLDEYYELQWWDKNGIPTPQIIAKLGINKEAIK